MKKYTIIFLSAMLISILLAGFLTRIDSAEIAQSANQNSQQEQYAECLQCHKYQQNHHPVDFKPVSAVPFPLYDGRITCITCHSENHRSGSDNFLRGGPYLQPRNFCIKCHHAGVYTNINPHLMLEKDGSIRTIIGGDSICLLCHIGIPDPATDETDDVQFRADIGFLCWRCHQPMANSRFFEQHFLMEPSLEMRRVIEQNEKKMKVLIPLVPRDRITCSTCHNPHQKGMIQLPAAAKGADMPARLRIPSPQLCFACHPFK